MHFENYFKDFTLHIFFMMCASVKSEKKVNVFFDMTMLIVVHALKIRSAIIRTLKISKQN